MFTVDCVAYPTQLQWYHYVVQVTLLQLVCPIILGANCVSIPMCRDVVYDSQVKAAIAAGAGAIMAWEELPMIIEPSQEYDYTWHSDGGEVIGALARYASCLVRRTCIANLRNSG